MKWIETKKKIKEKRKLDLMNNDNEENERNWELGHDEIQGSVLYASICIFYYLLLCFGHENRKDKEMWMMKGMSPDRNVRTINHAYLNSHNYSISHFK